MKDGAAASRVTVFYSPTTSTRPAACGAEASFTQVFPDLLRVAPRMDAELQRVAWLPKATSDKAVHPQRHRRRRQLSLLERRRDVCGFLEKWSIDFRYWDTNIDKAPGFGSCSVDLFSCRTRPVRRTLKFTF